MCTRCHEPRLTPNYDYVIFLVMVDKTANHLVTVLCSTLAILVYYNIKIGTTIAWTRLHCTVEAHIHGFT